MISLVRSIWRGTREMSMLSMKMLPVEVGRRRGRSERRVDFPDPVRPLIPIFSPGEMVIEISFNSGREALKNIS